MFWVVVARLYTAEDVGLASALISAALLLSFLSRLGLGLGLIRFLPDADTNASGLINSCFTLSGLAAVAITTIFLVGLQLGFPALAPVLRSPFFIAALVVFVAARTNLGLLHQVFVGIRRAEFTLIQALLLGLLQLTIIVAMPRLLKEVSILISWGMAAAATFVIGVLVVLPRIQPGYRPVPTFWSHLSTEVMRFSLVSYLSTGLWTVPIWLLPIMVVNLLGGEAGAYFYVSMSIAGLLYSIPAATSTSLLSEGSHAEAFLIRHVIRSLKLQVILLLPSIAVILAAGDRILLLFGREYSSEGTRLLWVLALASLPIAVNMVYLGVSRVKKRLKNTLLVAAAVALATLVGSYVLITPLGILGPGVAWLVAHTLIAAAVFPSILRLIKSKQAIACV